MVQFKNRYMVMEVFLDPNREFGTSTAEPIILTIYNVTKAIKDSILLNFGECGLAISLGSLQVKYLNPTTKVCLVRTSREDYQKVWAAITMIRCIGNCPVSFNLLDLSTNIRECKRAALQCDEAKFEHLKLMAGEQITQQTIDMVRDCFEKIKALER